MSEEKVIEIKALSPEENPAGKEMETADSEEKSIYDSSGRGYYELRYR